MRTATVLPSLLLAPAVVAAVALSGTGAASGATAVAPISVATFGARPGDALDDTAAIRSALAAAAQAGAATRTVLLPKGTYSVYPDVLTVPDGVTLTGRGAVLAARGPGFALLGVRSRTTSSAFTVDGRDQVVRGLVVAAESRDVTLTGIRVTGVASPTDPAVAGYVTNARQVVAGIAVEGDTDRVTLDRVTVDRVRAAVPPHAAVDATGSFETTPADAGWRHEHPVVDGRIADHAWRVVTSPVRAGRFAVRQELRRSDPAVNSGNRSEMTRPPEPFGEEHWYGFSILLPTGAEDFAADASPEVVAQWHSTPDDPELEKVSPPLSLWTEGGRWTLVKLWDAAPISTNGAINRAGQVERTDLGAYRSDKGRWVDWVFHVRWGYQDDQHPVTEVWKNGRPVYSKAGPNTFNDQVGPYFKWGIYKWEWGMATPPVTSTTKTRVIYHDEFRVAGADGSLAAVSPPTMPVDPAVTEVAAARGIWLYGGAGRRAPAHVTVRNSRISDVGPKDDGDGLVIQGNGGSVEPDADLLVTGTTFSRVAKRAMKIQVPGAVLSRNTIVNPWLGDNPYYVRDPAADTTDMYAAISVYAPRVTVTGNTVTGVGGAYAGIEVDHDATSDVTITGNALTNGPAARIAAGTGIRLDVPVRNVTLAGNTVRRATWGVRCAEPLTGLTLRKQTLRDVGHPWAGCLTAPQVAAAPGALSTAGGSVLTLRSPDFGTTAKDHTARAFAFAVNGRSARTRWTAPGQIELTVPAGAPGEAVLTGTRAGAPLPVVTLTPRYAAP